MPWRPELSCSQSLLPFLSWPADLGWHTSDGDFLGSPFQDTGLFHHLRESLKPGTKKKCRGSKATVSPFPPQPPPVFPVSRAEQATFPVTEQALCEG